MNWELWPESFGEKNSAYEEGYGPFVTAEEGRGSSPGRGKVTHSAPTPLSGQC